MNILTVLDIAAGKKLRGTLKWKGLSISLEHKKGDIRSGKTKDGTKWEHKMHCGYGYILGTEGTDGEHVDCYVGSTLDCKNVYVVHQNNPETGEHDEDKCFIGFKSKKAVKEMYLKHMPSRDFLGGISVMSCNDFVQKIGGKEYKGKSLMATLMLTDVTDAIAMDPIPGFHPPSLKKKYHVDLSPAPNAEETMLEKMKTQPKSVFHHKVQNPDNNGVNNARY